MGPKPRSAFCPTARIPMPLRKRLLLSFPLVVLGIKTCFETRNSESPAEVLLFSERLFFAVSGENTSLSEHRLAGFVRRSTASTHFRHYQFSEGYALKTSQRDKVGLIS